MLKRKTVKVAFDQDEVYPVYTFAQSKSNEDYWLPLSQEKYEHLIFLNEAAVELQKTLSDLYALAAQRHKVPPCVYRLRPGKICMVRASTGKGQNARCKEHKGKKNSSPVGIELL